MGIDFINFDACPSACLPVPRTENNIRPVADGNLFFKLFPTADRMHFKTVSFRFRFQFLVVVSRVGLLVINEEYNQQ